MFGGYSGDINVMIIMRPAGNGNHNLTVGVDYQQRQVLLGGLIAGSLDKHPDDNYRYDARGFSGRRIQPFTRRSRRGWTQRFTPVR